MEFTSLSLSHALYTTLLGWKRNPFTKTWVPLMSCIFIYKRNCFFPEVLPSDEMDMEMHCPALPSGKDLLPSCCMCCWYKAFSCLQGFSQLSLHGVAHSWWLMEEEGLWFSYFGPIQSTFGHSLQGWVPHNVSLHNTSLLSHPLLFPFPPFHRCGFQRQSYNKQPQTLVLLPGEPNLPHPSITWLSFTPLFNSCIF